MSRSPLVYYTHLVLLVTSALSPASAANIALPSCDFDLVASAVSSAADGDKIIIGPGTCDWQDATLKVTKLVSLAGSGPNQTILKRTASTTDPLIEYLCSQFTGSFSVSGIRFEGLFKPTERDRGLGLFHGCQDFAVNQNVFTGFASSGIDVSDHINRNPYQRGVISNNQFIENFRVGLGYGVAVSAGGRNNLDVAYGSQNFVFVEDNFFTKNRHAIASNLDATYVLRHNVIKDNYPNFSAVDTHGKTTPDSDDRRGTKRVEIYGNTIQQTGNFEFMHYTPMNPGYSGIALRGGEALIYDNSVLNYRFPIVLTVERGGECPDLEPPVESQPTDVYIWNNRMRDNRGGAVSDISLGGNDDCANIFTLGQDYFYAPKPNYTPYPYPHPLRAQFDQQFDILQLLPAILYGSVRRRARLK